MSQGRIRSSKPSLLDDRVITSLSDGARVLLLSAPHLADDHGNLHFWAEWIAGRVWADSRKKGVNAFMAEVVIAGCLEPYAVNAKPYAHIVGWSDPLSPMGQRIDNAGRPRVPVPKEDDKTIPDWFRQHRRVFYANARESARLAETRELSPTSSEDFGESRRGSGAYAHARALDQDMEEGSLTPPTPPSGGLNLVGADLAEAFAAGVRAVTGSAFVVEGARAGRLGRLVDAFGPNGTSTGEERAQWLRTTSTEFARSVDPRFGGFTVARMTKWLNAGRPGAAAGPPSEPALPSEAERKKRRREAKAVEEAMCARAAAEGLALGEQLAGLVMPAESASGVRRNEQLDRLAQLDDEEKHHGNT